MVTCPSLSLQHSKFHQKTDMIMKGLSDLMQSQVPTAYCIALSLPPPPS